MLTKLNKALSLFRFNEAANLIYEFFWHQFCDWYVEIAKLSISDPNTQVVLFKVLEKSLRILHPIMPFISEEIWQKLPGADKSISMSSWPHVQKQIIDKKVNAQMKVVIDVVVSARNLRSTLNIQPKDLVDLQIQCSDKEKVKILQENEAQIKSLAQIKDISYIQTKKQKSHGISAVISKDLFINIPLEGVVDIHKEKQRIAGQIKELNNFLKQKEARLKNKGFLKNAPPEVVEAEKEKASELREKIEKLKEVVQALG
jgi:valyl-tRNA synthetase